MSRDSEIFIDLTNDDEKQPDRDGDGDGDGDGGGADIADITRQEQYNLDLAIAMSLQEEVLPSSS